jgi:dipeptidase D
MLRQVLLLFNPYRKADDMNVKDDNDRILRLLKPALLWKIFGDLALIPRGSGNETALRNHLGGMAKLAGLSTQEDTAGNLLIRVPATSGCGRAPTVILQAHLDMVCEADPPAAGQPAHDFTRDPLRLRRDGDWLKASGTTLGADNGIGVAAAMAIALSSNLKHGPLEILLTADEEDGMSGVNGLSPDWLKGRLLLNLDEEVPHAICIGCAGGSRIKTTIPIEWVEAPPGDTGATLTLSGLQGGHSACDIDKGRGNAVKLLAHAVAILFDEFKDIRLAGMMCGDKPNAIPREGEVWLSMPEGRFQTVCSVIEELGVDLATRFSNEPNFCMRFEKAPRHDRCYSREMSQRLIDLLLAFPSGVMAMNKSLPGLVETSSNLASCQSDLEVVRIGNMPRSSHGPSLRELIARLMDIAQQAAATAAEHDTYPGYQPNRASRVTALVTAAHERLFGAAPKIVATHGGLEFGPIAAKYPAMDMGAFGPHIVNPHSPNEAVLIPSVQEFWTLLCGVLEDVSKMR